MFPPSLSRKNLGNLLILFSLIGFIYIYFPIIKLHLFLPEKPNLTEEEKLFTIEIPKINAYAPVVDNVDPWIKDEYLLALQKGVAQAKGFAKPGEGGTIYLFAHSSDYPWNITYYNTVFFRLESLEIGDLVNITKDGREYKYKVIEKKEVWPNQVEFITKAKGNKLILQTCTPIGTTLKRLLVFAKPIN